MSGLTLYCAGVVDLSALTCSTGWQTVVTNPPFDPSQLDPVGLGAMFGAGFFVMLPVWAACEGVRFLLSMVK